MRIQHNIAALNSYRNLTNNNSAVAKNLEKLSSGYRINRAGDDAAGLAISEKMRAQITGLQTAQKNANDGISLVQTAEGALTEVHSMLNRMVELATQSANGTYDNDVDRANLQKEVNSLMDEINRISDSTNFNGINLLNGSMDVNGTKTDGAFSIGGTGLGALPGVGNTLGTDTVLHQSEAQAVKQTIFSVDLHNLSFANGTGDKLTLKIGDNTFTLEGDDSGALDAKAIAAAMKDGTFKFDDNGTATAVDPNDVKIGDGTFKVTVSGTRITFTQDENDTETVNGDMKVEIAGTAGAAGGGGGTAAVAAKYSSKITIAATLADGDEIDIGGTIIKVGAADDITAADAADAGKLATVIATKLQAAGNAEYDIAADGDTITWTAKTEGAVGGDGPGNPPTALTDANGKVTFGTLTEETIGVDAVPGGAADPDENPVTGDHNASTTVIQNKADGTDARLASTTFELTKDMAANGGYIRIGDTKYEFTTDAANKDKAGMVYIGDLVDDKGVLKDENLATAAERLTVAAADNDTYTVGFNGNKITVTEQPTYSENDPKYDLTTKEGIEESLGFGTVTKNPDGKALTLQIGDTSDSFNQLTLSIGSTSAEALGIKDINIGTQEGAAAAVDKIKAAINKVSSTRGDLGAVQNRLEHTINNLSVQTENITAAESRIRDVDMAEEMMAYTKNNILVQAAQAMLAQANQVPQGVLQLLQ